MKPHPSYRDGSAVECRLCCVTSAGSEPLLSSRMLLANMHVYLSVFHLCRKKQRETDREAGTEGQGTRSVLVVGAGSGVGQ